MAEPLPVASSVLDLVLLGSRVVVARVEVDRLRLRPIVGRRPGCRRRGSSWSSIRRRGRTRVVVVAGPVADVRPRCARTVKSCSSWTLGSGRSGRREGLVVDGIVSLRVKVKHAGEAGRRLVGWKTGLEGQWHAKANCFIGKIKANSNKGKRKWVLWGLLAFSTA